MPVILAKSAGFCFGVKRAVDRVHTLLAEGGAGLHPRPDYPQSTGGRRAAAHGVRTVGDPAEADENAVLVIRSHGVPQSTYDAIPAARAAFQ